MPVPARKALLLGLFVVVLPVRAASADEGAGRPSPDAVREAAALNEQALDALRAGDPVAATELLGQAWERLPGDPVVSRNLAAALAASARKHLDGRKPDDARRLLDRAVELEPGRLLYRYARAEVRVALGREAERFFAREDLARVLAVDPDHRPSLVLLGSISWLERDLEDAVAQWSRALELDGDDPALSERLARARRELEVERDYDTIRGAHFLIRHAPDIPVAFAAEVLTLAETAWGELCPRFGHYPEEEVVVTLYPGAELQEALRLHRWVAGLSDGTIRIRVPPRARASDLRGVLRHEFAHHLIRRVAPQAPAWLHEGLAQLAEDALPGEAERRLRSQTGLRDAELSLGVAAQSDPRRAARFYDLALAFTAWLHGQGGDALVLALLDDLAHGLTVEQSLQQRLGAGRAELFERWRERLRAG